jgi:hypothetical protein
MPKSMAASEMSVALSILSRFGLTTEFIAHLQLVTTIKDCSHRCTQITIGHTRSPQSVRLFTSRCLVAACKGGHYPSSGFPNCPPPQLPASHSNSSQRLNTNGYMTARNLSSRHGPRRKYHSCIAVYGPLTSNGRF